MHSRLLLFLGSKVEQRIGFVLLVSALLRRKVRSLLSPNTLHLSLPVVGI